jgi:hypothetical protein
MSKKLFAQREKIIEEYKEKKKEFAKYEESFGEDLTEVFDLLCAKIPKLKIKAVNILSELYPDIQFELKDLLHEQFALEINLSTLNKFIKDVIEKNPTIYCNNNPIDKLTNNKILIIYNPQGLFIQTKSYLYTLSITQDHKFYKIYRIMCKIKEIENVQYYNNDEAVD